MEEPDILRANLRITTNYIDYTFIAYKDKGHAKASAPRAFLSKTFKYF